MEKFIINQKLPKISFYFDTNHNKKLFSAISEKINHSELISKFSLKKVKETPLKCDEIINKVENAYTKYIRYKYEDHCLSFKNSIKKWQRLGFSRSSLQRKYRKYKFRKEFEKWVTFFTHSDTEVIAAWCPIKPKRRIIFEAALFCNKSLLYFEDSPIPGFIICDYKGVNAGLSLKKDINFYRNLADDNSGEDNPDLNCIFNNITQRNPIFKKIKQPGIGFPQSKKHTIYCPLQVQDDTQIVQYGSWIKSIGEFIDIVYAASRFLPDNWQLLIREHPSCSISFSKKLVGLSDDKFVIDNISDSTDIIKNSSAVVTINSSVGFHALLKYKPVIVCGEAFWGFNPLTHTASNQNDLIEKFSNISHLKTDTLAIQQYMKFLLNDIFIPITYDGDSLNINKEHLEIIYRNSLISLSHYSEIKNVI